MTDGENTTSVCLSMFAIAHRKTVPLRPVTENLQNEHSTGEQSNSICGFIRLCLQHFEECIFSLMPHFEIKGHRNRTEISPGPK